MENIPGLGMKDCLSSPRLGWKCFNSLKTEEDEPNFTYNDRYMRWFLRENINGGQVCAFNQFFKPKICDSISKHLSEELVLKRNASDFIGAYTNYKKKKLKLLKKENEKKNIMIIEMKMKNKKKIINEKLSIPPIHQL